MMDIPSYTEFLNEGKTDSPVKTAKEYVEKFFRSIPGNIICNPDQSEEWELKVQLCRPPKVAGWTDQQLEFVDTLYSMGLFLADANDAAQDNYAGKEIGHAPTLEQAKAAIKKLGLYPHLIFEPTLGKLAPPQKILYHIAPQSVSAKIEAQGLRPMAQYKRSMHPDRVYLVAKKGVKGLASELNAGSDQAVFAVDCSGLRLFRDQNMPPNLGFYANEPIPKERIARVDFALNEDDGGLDVFRKGKAVHTPEGPLKSLKLQDVDDNVVVMHSREGDFIHARGFTLVYFMDSPANAQLMKAGKIDYLLFPPQTQSTMFSRSPIKDIWKKPQHPDMGGSEHILGAIEAYVTKEIFIDMMSVRPGFKGSHIATMMVDALKKNWPGLSVRTSHRTSDGSKFFSKYDPNIPQNESMRLPTFEEFVNEEKVKGGLSSGMSLSDIAKKHNVSVDSIEAQLAKGKKVELEHTDDQELAAEIAKDHLAEDPKYYDKLAKMEEE